MRVLLIGLIFLLSVETYSQTRINADSLFKTIEWENNDTEKIKRYNELFSLTAKSQPVFTIKFGKKILSTENITSNIAKADIQSCIGLAYSEIEKHDSALIFFNKALFIYDKLKDEEKKANLWLEMGYCSYYSNKVQNGYTYLNKALGYYTKTKNWRNVSRSYQNLGSLFNYAEEYDKAIDYYKKAVEVCQNNNIYDKLTAIYANMASVYHNLKDYDKAIENYKKILPEFEKKEDPYSYGVTLNNIGLSYEQKEDFNKSIYYYEKAYQIFKKLNKKNTECRILFNIASIEYKTNKWNKSIKTYNEIINTATKNNLPTIKQGVYEELALMHYETNRFKKAYEYQQKSNALKDSIAFDEHTRELKIIEAKYESEQNLKDLKLLKTKNEINQQKIKNQFVANIAIVCFLVGCAFFIIVIRQKNKNYIKINGNYLREINQRKQAEEDLKELAASLEEQVENRTNELESSNKQLEQEIEQQMLMSIELKKAKNNADNANRLKTIFLANMSHEIRTPLNGILGFSALLERPKLTPEKQSMYLSIINKTGKHLLTIINDIIDLSKIETNEFLIHKEPVNLKKLLIEEINYFSRLKEDMKKDSVSIDYVFYLKENQTLLVDSTRLKQVLNNLVSNALKFTNLGSITVTARNIENNSYYFSVKDNGIGISDDKIKYVFEAFRQAQEGLTKEYGGVGVGLSISSKIVKLMGGELQVNSTLGEGSNFFFTLNLEEVTVSKTV